MTIEQNKIEAILEKIRKLDEESRQKLENLRADFESSERAMERAGREILEVNRNYGDEVDEAREELEALGMDYTQSYKAIRDRDISEGQDIYWMPSTYRCM